MSRFTLRNLKLNLTFIIFGESFPEWRTEWGNPNDCEIDELILESDNKTNNNTGDTAMGMSELAQQVKDLADQMVAQAAQDLADAQAQAPQQAPEGEASAPAPQPDQSQLDQLNAQLADLQAQLDTERADRAAEKQADADKLAQAEALIADAKQ